jgi:hypothetical protein
MSMPRRRTKPTAFEVTYPGETQDADLDTRCQGNRCQRGDVDHSDSVRNVFGLLIAPL